MIVLVLVVVLGSGAAQQQDNCVDISKFGPVRYNETASEMCDYELVTRSPLSRVQSRTLPRALSLLKVSL